MKQHFIDAGAFVAQSYTSDQYHKEALAIAQRMKNKHPIGITTDFVLSEVLTFLQRKLGHQSAIKFHETIKSATDLIIIYTSQKDFDRAIEIFKQYQDKTFSFTDCTSFTIMRNLKITQAFTFDSHFQQAGFEILKPK